MTAVNPCLKRTFTFFNILFAVVGALFIALALTSQALTNTHGGQDIEGRTTGLILLYFLGSVTMVIAILGVYGAQKENRVALIVFLVCMVLGSLMMLKIGVPSVIARPKLKGIMEETFHRLLPLDEATKDVQTVVETLQTGFSCCGLFGYQDWRQQIPDSCFCGAEVEEDQCQLVDTKLVFRKTCFPVVLHYITMISDIILGVVFTLAVLALLGMVLSSLMIHQLRVAPIRPTMVLTVPPAFIPQPPKYQQLYNPPEY